jgi:hypothetical protein
MSADWLWSKTSRSSLLFVGVLVDFETKPLGVANCSGGASRAPQLVAVSIYGMASVEYVFESGVFF